MRVGRVEAIRLADEWVEADLRVDQGVELPAQPAVIAASQSLFGEWSATIVSRDQPQDDPNVRLMLAETARPGGERWPGATLPDVGQLTAQAGRIATDIAAVAAPGAGDLRLDRGAPSCGRASRTSATSPTGWSRFTENQTSRLNQVTGNVERTSDAVLGASEHLREHPGPGRLRHRRRPAAGDPRQHPRPAPATCARPRPTSRAARRRA